MEKEKNEKIIDLIERVCIFSMIIAFIAIFIGEDWIGFIMIFVIMILTIMVLLFVMGLYLSHNRKN
jgi:VIT1/CCC1 family predicted Fe2+/Mn2+ transporter